MTSEQTTTPNIFPALRYRDASAALEWLAKAFGFTQTFAVPGPDGIVAHAELRLGAGTIMLGSLSDEERDKGPSAVGHSIYVQVDDLDAHYERARSAGAKITRELDDTEYGSREYAARDLDGYDWSFGTYLPSSGE